MFFRIRSTKFIRHWAQRDHAKSFTFTVVLSLLVYWSETAAAQETATSYSDLATFRDCSGCPTMVVIPAGWFVVGSPEDEADRETNEGPQRTVTIARPFSLGRTEVTVAQFEAFVEDTGYQAASICPNVVAQRLGEAPAQGSWRKHSYEQNGDHPVACVTRADVLAYIDWLSQRTSETYRLPSEAEWEYAAREGGNAPAGQAADICRRANTADAAMKRAVPDWPDRFAPCDDGYGAGTAPVASFAANAFGLFDMAGNLWELTQDCYAEDYVNIPTDGSAYEAIDCPRRTVRGGGWLNGVGSQGGDGEHRPANRGRNSPGAHFDSMGFRVARDLPR